jgi:uncharacterized protein (TIGR02266 family)
MAQNLLAEGLTPLEFETLEEAVPAISAHRPLLAAVHFQYEGEERVPAWEMLHTYAQLQGMSVLAFGQDDFRTVREAFAAGADDFLPMPIASGALQSRAERLAQLREHPPTTPRVPRTQRSNRHILIAASDVVVRMRIEALLQEAGHSTHSVEQGSELLALLAQPNAAKPSVCFIDTTLPELEGMEGVRRLRSTSGWEGIPVAAILGAGKGTVQMELLRQLGVRDFIDTTDVAIESVVPLVSELLAAQSARRGAIRMPLLAPGTFQAPSLGSHWEPGFIYNLSESGVFLRTLLPPQKGETVALRFALESGDRPVQGSAHVAWVQPYGQGQSSPHPPGVGLLFQDLKDGDRPRIEDALRLQAGGQ